MNKNSYPNYDYSQYVQAPRDIQKWTQAAREVYYKMHKGINKDQALKEVINGWDRVEELDFKNWLRFYEEGAQNKYKEGQVKQAQFFFPEPLRNTQPQQLNMQEMKDPKSHPDMLKDEKAEIIRNQRNKIMGRLDSAEKLLRSHEGHIFAGDELEQLIEALYQLKKKIQMVNKISTSTRLYQDMIIREANILVSKGFKDGSSFLIKVAQEIPNAAEAPSPINMGGQAGTLPGQAPGQVPPPAGDMPIDVSMPDIVPGVPQNAAPQGVATEQVQGEPLSQGMKEFLDGLDSANEDFEEKEENDNDDFVVEAQEMPQPRMHEEPLEVEEDPNYDPEVKAGRDFDALLDHTLANITVQDVINKLEDVSKIFKTREIPRIISIVDLMLNRLGLSSFFPEIAESSAKANDMTMYIGSRLDAVLSQLRGTIQTTPIDLKNEGAPPTSPTAQRLTEMDEKEKAKKQMRKEIEEQNLMQEKPKPEIEMQEDLGQPAAPIPAEAPPATPTPPAPAAV